MPAQALNVFHCPLAGTRLIEASAGTGKTWNICGLFLRLLLERRLEVQQILVVTFTNAATAELRDRVRTRIAETLARLRGTGPAGADPFVDTLLATLRDRHGLVDEDMALRLDLALQTFDEASIFTIHGFCQRALADTPFTAGMPMSLELLTDDTELRMEVVHDFWRRQVAGDALPPALASYLLSNKESPGKWAALLKRQLAKPLSRVIWSDAPDEALVETTALDTAALEQAHAAARATWHTEREAIVACVTEALPCLPANVYKATSVQTASASWDKQLAGSDPLAAPAGLDKLDLFTPARLVPKKGQQAPRMHAFFTQAGELLGLLETTRQSLATARQRLLRQLLTEGPTRLRRLKRERRVVAFDDMLFNLHAGLTSGRQPGLAAALQARFPAALIDEFQDTDPLQFAIFRTIYGGSAAPLFLVGDPKQAIYSFRNADLHTYLQARSEAVAEYTLADNQRSTRELLAGLNGLFSINPQAFVLAGLGYQPVNFGARPRKAWHDSTAARAPLQLWELPQDGEGQPLPKKLARRAAAEACAGEIARLLGSAQRHEVLLGDRPLSGGDIAVLVRSHAQGSRMRQALAALGVGSVELSQASIFQSPDAEDLERVLRAILEPARDRWLRAALATDMLGFDAAGIEALSADEASLLDIVTRFAGYRELWLQRGVGVMLRSLMGQECVHRRLLARADGERRLTNLLHLSEMLHQASEQHGSPELLLRWLQTQRRDGSTDDAAQLRLESDRNLVQIITIHKSKGLEFPVVFCPFLWDGHPGGSPATLEGREYHDADGLPVLDFSDGGDDAPIKAQIGRDRAAENLRLIYVALTRAVQRCYLVVGSYTNKIGRNLLTSEGSRSRLNSLVAGAGLSPDEWQQNRLTPAAIASAWQAFSAAHPGSVGLAPLPAGPWARVDPVAVSPEALAALPAPARIPGAWWIGSYSSLSQGVRHEGAAVDHDARIATSETDLENKAGVLDDDDILNFPRGPEAGNCMHAVFERVDFTDPVTWSPAITSALGAQAQSPMEPAVAARLPRMLNRMLGDVLNTRLPAGMALSEVGPTRRLVELEFSLPAGHLTVGALAGLLRDHGYPVPPLSFGALEGYLRGFIDLVFEHGGRYYILDWKSNHLGRRPDAYGAPYVARAMAEHGYHLQYLLYAVALHRYLERRRPDYRYDDHFGGAIYLFVRGVRPGWVGADGQATGVHFDRPRRSLVERLSALFAAQPASRGVA
ncbi:MAG: exodeoxyribonuclease V subunit beta [Rubrivivax sp.]|nr:exodeoxyribonuclease V subunit beta [Rubrivivax sp.]